MSDVIDGSPEHRRGYAQGMAHAYGQVFDAFSAEFNNPGTPLSASSILALIQAQWSEAEAMILEGVSE